MAGGPSKVSLDDRRVPRTRMFSKGAGQTEPLQLDRKTEKEAGVVHRTLTHVLDFGSDQHMIEQQTGHSRTSAIDQK